MSKETTTEIVVTERTSVGLRNTLFTTLDQVIAGKIAAGDAQAICKICAQIINSVNTEIEYYKHIGRFEKDGIKLPDTILTLGSAP